MNWSAATPGRMASFDRITAQQAREMLEFPEPKNEDDLQHNVVKWLRANLDGDLWGVRVGLEGVHLSPKVRNRCQYLGMESGWLDIQIVGPFPRLYFIELKFGKNTTTGSQKKNIARLNLQGWPNAVCWTLADVQKVCREWGIL